MGHELMYCTIIGIIQCQNMTHIKIDYRSVMDDLKRVTLFIGIINKCYKLDNYIAA